MLNEYLFSAAIITRFAGRPCRAANGISPRTAAAFWIRRGYGMISGVRFLIVISLAVLAACSGANSVDREGLAEMPDRFLWAWERPEDLRFADPERFGVAFLAQTLVLDRSDVLNRPRRQPLEVADGAYLIAVTRIETAKDSGRRAAFSEEQRERIVSLVRRSAELANVRAVQIDFDAAVSEREFYKELMKGLRQELPESMPLTMTALASWCTGDAWFNSMPVAEAVPMAFQMGADNERIRAFLRAGNDWNEPLCRGSYGVSLEEPLEMEFREGRRIFYFKNRPWTAADIEKLERRPGV